MMVEVIRGLIDFVLNIDVHLGEIVADYGIVTYVILFVIIFIETGLVVTPFLPGDSLLFAAGALAALGLIQISWVVGILILAAVLGDTVNYGIGRFLGKKIVEGRKPLIKKRHVKRTENFYEKYGGKTIILARFVPIIRTIAPFVAGIGKMSYGNFIIYNVVGGLAWVSLFSFLGYFFGSIPAVKNNFSLVILGIIFVSIIPMIFEMVKGKKKE